MFRQQLATWLAKTPRIHLILLSSASLLLAVGALLPTSDAEAKRVTIELAKPLQPAPPAPSAPAAAPPQPNHPPAAQVHEPVAHTTSHPAATPPAEKWLEVTVRSGDNLTTLFQKAGLGANTLYPFLNASDAGNQLKRLMSGERLDFLLENGELQKLRYVISKLESVLFKRETDQWTSVEEFREPEITHTYRGGTIDQSLFVDASKAGLSDSKIMELAGIFGWDVDFALDIRQGDRFAVLYEERWLDGEKISDGAIVAAEFTNQGKTFQAIRYRDSEGRSNFYTPSGDSMRKAFLRTPVDFTRISSRFNPSRKHPVFKTNRPHRGVDYAAPTGTPIKASGDGKVIFAGVKGGYGKTVVLQHGGRYSTLYAHMSRIKPGMKRGKRISQGDTIGYVGSTGYATGPHLHYEFRVDDVHRNPLTVKLPQAEPLPRKEMANFRAIAQPLLAQLDTQRNTQLASSQ